LAKSATNSTLAITVSNFTPRAALLTSYVGKAFKGFAVHYKTPSLRYVQV